ncbi:hypothetical protein ACWC5I_20595 [Kitasatospora sp. NPDC001574]
MPPPTLAEWPMTPSVPIANVSDTAVSGLYNVAAPGTNPDDTGAAVERASTIRSASATSYAYRLG